MRRRAVVLVFLLGCGPGGGSGSGAIECPSDRGPVGITVSASRAEACVFSNRTGRLTMRAVYSPTGPMDTRGDYIELNIANFRGTGSYMTSTSPSGSSLTVRGFYRLDNMPQQGDYGSDPIDQNSPGGCPPRVCTITATGAAPTVGSNTMVNVSVSCGQLNTQSSSCVTCSVPGGPFVLPTMNCEASD